MTTRRAGGSGTISGAHTTPPQGDPAARAETGRAARRDVPISSHMDMPEADERPDPVEVLEAQAATRLPELVPIRYGRLRGRRDHGAGRYARLRRPVRVDAGPCARACR
jgi:hypothetical protein